MSHFFKAVKDFYSLKNFFSLRKSLNFSINLLLFNIFLITIIRWVCDFFWIGNLNFLLNIYIWFLLLCIYVITFPIITDYLIRKISGLKYKKSTLLGFFAFSSKLWWLVIPVSIINGLFNADTTITISIFKYIPTFMEINNYLPIGMVMVIPLFIVFTTWFIRKTYSQSLWKSFLYGLLGLSIIYVIFYQWLWQFFYYLLNTFIRAYQLTFGESYLISMPIFIETGLIFLLFFIKPCYKVFKKHSLNSYYSFVILNLIILSCYAYFRYQVIQ